MENATQALFMAAGVLIAVMIISLGIYLFTSASTISETYDKTTSSTELQKFNAQFNKFITSDVEIPKIQLKNGEEIAEVNDFSYYNTISDVVSAINLAYSLNSSFNYDIQRGIQVQINFKEFSDSDINFDKNFYGITPKIQEKIFNESLNENKYSKDRNSIYKLGSLEKKEDYVSAIIPTNLISNNTLMQKFSDCALYNNKKVYKYYFKGNVDINDGSGMVDKLSFELIDNSDTYNKLN